VKILIKINFQDRRQPHHHRRQTALHQTKQIISVEKCFNYANHSRTQRKCVIPAPLCIHIPSYTDLCTNRYRQARKQPGRRSASSHLIGEPIMSMPSRHHILFASATFGTLLVTTSLQAATSTQQPATGTQPMAKNAAAKNTSTQPPTATAPIAGILDGSNGETINVHGHHAADGTGAKYMNKIVYLGPLGNRDTLDTPYSVMGVPHDVIVNQQLRNINDMAQYLPSVQLEIRGDPNTSRPQSRGFEADVVARAFSFQSGSYPAAVKKFLHSVGET
jgi:hypothetical protein